jgi:1,4-dihydroxy-2-naphthoate octaprenyltransferase
LTGRARDPSLSRGVACGAEERLMFLALAVLLALAWVIGFVVLHTTSVAIHTLIILAALSAVLHGIKVRRYRAPREALPKDAIK